LHIGTRVLARGLAASAGAGALLVAALAGPTIASPAPPSTPHSNSARAVRATAHGVGRPNFRGIISIFSCSAALVRWPQSRPHDLALLLTNGHCYAPSDKTKVDREVIVNRRDNRPVTLLKRDGSDLVTLHTSRVIYSTSFKTDVGLYRLKLTYVQIRHRYHVPALTLSDHPPQPSAKVLMPSGFSKKVYSCTLNGFAYRLFNDTFDWRHSLRFAPSSTCRTIHGTSGSPVLDPTTRTVLGVNNAINLSPPQCASGAVCGARSSALDCSVSLCERSKAGRVTQHVHRRYGQQTWWLTTCVGTDRVLDLDLTGCLLPKPRPKS
jgi:Trypsin-like peptidase domain